MGLNFKKILINFSLVRPESDVVNQETGVARDVVKEEQLKADLAQDTQEGKASGVLKDEARIRHLIEDRNSRSERIIEDFERIIRKELYLTRDLVTAIQSSGLPAAQKKAFVNHIHEQVFIPVERELTLILQQAAAFEHFNPSLYKALGRASLARDELFNVQKLRKVVRREKKELRRDIRKARSASAGKGKQFEAILKVLDEDTVTQLQFLNKALRDDIISLQKDISLLCEYEAHLKALRDKQRFPKELADQEIKGFEDARKEALARVEEQLKGLTRLFMSEAEHTEATVEQAEHEIERKAA